MGGQEIRGTAGREKSKRKNSNGRSNGENSIRKHGFRLSLSRFLFSLPEPLIWRANLVTSTKIWGSNPFSLVPAHI
jgi:hypothetical protein